MVSSVESGGVVDTEAGTIVWVRRRNGSWWPGRILGPRDLGASHLMSPRSGTPVKLLGREDASVDWYNIEKSKRVKAFRCGEFDDCIERAAASHGLPAKKREKYARREDAILHALELEKQFVEKKCAKSVKSKGKSTEAERKPSTTVKVIENGNGKLDRNELCQPGKRVDKSYLVEKNGIPSLVQRAKHAFHPSLEDHSITMGSQIKELQDVGLKAVPLNTMLYSATSEDSNRTAIDGQVYGVSGNGPCLENSADSDSRNSLGKGKRLLDGYVEEPIPKRHRINHPFVDVRRSSEELPSHSLRPDMYAWGLSAEGARFSESTPAESSHMFSNNQGLQGYTELPFSRSEVGANSAQLGTLAEETISGSSEETESDSSETHSIDQNLVKGMLLSDAETCVRAQPRLCDISAMQAGPESISSDESDEVSFEGKSCLNYVEHNLSSDEVSRWQLKGKRNVRNMGKRNTRKTYLDARRGPLTLTETSHGQSYGHDNGFSNEAVFSEDDFDLQPVGYGQRGYLPFHAEAKRHNNAGPNMIDWESGLGRSLRGYWGERSERSSPMFIGRSGHDMLIDVDLQVQATRQGEHVPWVSLMSKLNGQAIIGHPVQIESLEAGSTDVIFLSTSDDEFRYECDRDNVPPMWKTARRTANVRAVRPHQQSQSQLDIDENTDYQPQHLSGKRGSKKSPARKGSLSKITNSHVSRPPQGTNKAYRKVNSLSNQKTKPLSSLGFNQVTSGKPVVSGSTTVACIPVKLAFSRLLEAVGRP